MKHYWHFVREDKRLGYEDGRKVTTGRIYKVNCEPVLCESGLHASARAIDALSFAPGPIICRVTLGGKVIHAEDKSVATERTVLWLADATNTLHEMACWFAERALKLRQDAGDKVDERSWSAIKVKRLWLQGKATDDELSAAESAAESAAWSAARSAAESAAWSAARSAAESAAWSAARSAARSAAWSAAREIQNKELHKCLMRLKP